MIIIVGESASGKSTIEKVLQEKYKMDKVVSYTTRPPRDGEVSGVDYNFIGKNDFLDMENKGIFAEVGHYRGWFYGSTKDQYGDNVVAVLTPHGLRQLKRQMPNEKILSIYINVPRKDRLVKMLQREPFKDDTDECCRRSSVDVGAFDGVEDEVDFVVNNDGYEFSPETIANLIYNTYKEV